MNERRNHAILMVALDQARQSGYRNLTRDGVASAAEVAAGSINAAFGNMDGLRQAVMVAAVERDIPEIVAQGLADQSPIAKNAPPDLKTRALALLA
jgi:AcrR family transcriptional regulator